MSLRRLEQRVEALETMMHSRVPLVLWVADGRSYEDHLTEAADAVKLEPEELLRSREVIAFRFDV